MKKLFTILLLLITTVIFAQTDTLVKYAFNDSAIAVGAYPTSGLAVNLNNPITTVGGTSVVKFNTLGATTWCARATGWDAGNGTKYWQVKLTTTGYNTLTLSSKQRSSTTGPRNFKVQYKHYYGGTWSDVTGGAVLNADNWTSGVLTNLALPAACNNLDSLYLRWVMTSDSALNHTVVAVGGASRIDNIIVIGDVITGINVYAPQHDVTFIQNKNTMTLTTDEPTREIMIYDILGNLVYNNIKPQTSTTINTDKFDNGIYIVKILFGDNTVETRKVSLM